MIQVCKHHDEVIWYTPHVLSFSKGELEYKIPKSHPLFTTLC